MYMYMYAYIPNVSILLPTISSSMICVVVSCVQSPYHRLKGSAPSTTKHKARNAGTFRFSAGGRQQSVAFWCSRVQHFGDFGIGRKFKNWHHLSYKFCRWIANPDLERWKPFGIPAGRRKGCFPEKKYQKPGGWKGSLSLKCWKNWGMSIPFWNQCPSLSPLLWPPTHWRRRVTIAGKVCKARMIFCIS